MDRLTALEIFTTVVSEGSFSGAARHLGMSKSAVSKHVASLEDRLGARLLNRTTRRLSLTDAGAVYYERANRIVADAIEAEAEVSQLSSSPRGVLRVSAPLSFGIRHLGPLLPEFMQQNPVVEVDLRLDDRLVDLVEDGFDVALRVTDPADSSMMVRRLCPSRAVLVASQGYVDSHGLPDHPMALKEHPCLVYSNQPYGLEWRLKSITGERLTVRLGDSRLRANNGDILRQAALQGVGVAILPTFFVGEDLRHGRLVRICPDWEGLGGQVSLLWPHARFTPAKVRVFVDYMVNACGTTPPWDDYGGGE
jgi:DNA-binding transcriptional LysR family regulator